MDTEALPLVAGWKILEELLATYDTVEVRTRFRGGAQSNSRAAVGEYITSMTGIGWRRSGVGSGAVRLYGKGDINGTTGSIALLSNLPDNSIWDAAFRIGTPDKKTLAGKAWKVGTPEPAWNYTTTLDTDGVNYGARALISPDVDYAITRNGVVVGSGSRPVITVMGIRVMVDGPCPAF